MSEEARLSPPPPPEPLSAPVWDAHTHLDAIAQRFGVPADAAFVAATMEQAAASGVSHAVTVGDTIESSRWCVAAATAHPAVCAAVAVHPTEIAGLTDADYAELARLASDPNVVAVGETGLDYYWQRTDPVEQRDHFRRHIALARAVGKPLMIHDRDAHADVLEVLESEGVPGSGLTVIFHAFSGDSAIAAQCAAAGYLLSFAGVITFRNAPGLRAAAAVVPREQLLVETDAPFLTPHPYRGRPNAPYLLPWTVRGLAAARGEDPADLSAALAANSARVFGPRAAGRRAG